MYTLIVNDEQADAACKILKISDISVTKCSSYYAVILDELMNLNENLKYNSKPCLTENEFTDVAAHIYNNQDVFSEMSWKVSEILEDYIQKRK